jgi:hypothetical protein
MSLTYALNVHQKELLRAVIEERPFQLNIGELDDPEWDDCTVNELLEGVTDDDPFFRIAPQH